LSEKFEDRFTTGAITAKECLDFQELSKAMSRCIENYNGGSGFRRTIWLVGDSHAFTLLNGIRQVAAQEKANLRVIARRGTAFPLPKNYLKLRTRNPKDDLISSRLMSDADRAIVKQGKRVTFCS